MASEPQPNPAESPLSIAEDQPAAPHQDTFFLTRGRLLMEAPLVELAGLAEQIMAQAEALGHPQLIPEFRGLRDRANALRAELTQLTPIPSNLPAEPPKPSKGTRFLLKWLAANQTDAEKKLLAESSAARKATNILVVEDEPEVRDLVAMLLQNLDYNLSIAEDGAQAMEILKHSNIDLVLLDLLLPEVNGYELLEEMKANESWQNIPVIVLSGTTDMDNVVRCVELGAEDFLPKPFNPLLLRTRIAAGLEKKRLRDQEQAFLQQLNTEREKSERLLLNVLPSAIAERLKQGEETIADSFPDVTVLFADLANFTKLSEQTPAPKLVELLNEVFSAFDGLAEHHGLEKIKTIGDSYMAVGGLPLPASTTLNA